MLISRDRHPLNPHKSLNISLEREPPHALDGHAEKGDILLFRSTRPSMSTSPPEKAEYPLFHGRDRQGADGPLADGRVSSTSKLNERRAGWLLGVARSRYTERL
jgi:hypothetical protein